ncbi:hypothetical protein [Aeromicrobium sp. NPDC092404]|uniref:hypothetical protein n=1 Tax=Aeromicrobium sp. NPDC092404 TaxID=3154976 RepID=UPI00342B1E3A
MTDEEAIRLARTKLRERYGLTDMTARLMLAVRADRRGRTLVQQARSTLEQRP